LSKTAAIVTLGCAKNSVDSEHIKGSLQEAGFILINETSKADYIIINTCGFIEAAKQDSIDTILELNDLKNNHKDNTGINSAAIQPKLVVTGCLAQRYFHELNLEMPEIDILVGIGNEHEIGRLLIEDNSKDALYPVSPERDFMNLPERVLSDRFHAYLQIADGCDTRCSYCAIPIIRGNYHSKPIDKIIEEAHWLDSEGIKEINIIAQDTGKYGYDLYGKRRLAELLLSLTGFKNVEWLRLLYLQPFCIDDALIDAFKQNRLLLPYIDMPFQHASSKILRAMNRNATGNDILALLAWVRREIPGVVIRSTAMVGFPGETDDDFAELVEFVKRAEFDYMGIFEYSEEEGTKAAAIKNKVPSEVIRERYHELSILQDLISQSRSEQRIGLNGKALLTSEADSSHRLYEARAWWQAPEVDGFTYISGSAFNKQIVDMTIDDFDGCDFHGRISDGPG
jgi:ribosomal protein S12 methylthiotransferase